MQIDRLFMITYYLLNKKSTTAKELSERFEVSVRTILRDIDILSSSGIPIYTLQGTGGGIFLDKDYVLNKTVLTEEEQQKIVLALQSISATGQFDTDYLTDKLANMFSKTYPDIIEIDFSRWGRTHTDQAKFEQLMSAILASRKVSFSYINMYIDKSKRTICPVKLKFQSKAWYLLGYSMEKYAYRTFKINRISDLQVLEECFDKTILVETTPPTQENPPANLILLELRFSPSVSHRLYDDFDATDIVLESNGACSLKINMPETDWIYGYILSFGNDVEVVGPEHIKNKVCETAMSIIKKYSFST